jgi:hypothetical protein
MKKFFLSTFVGFTISFGFSQIEANDDNFVFTEFDALPIVIDLIQNDNGLIDPTSLSIDFNSPDASFTVNQDGTITLNTWNSAELNFTYTVCNDGNPILECGTANVNIFMNHQVFCLDEFIDDAYNSNANSVIVLNLAENDNLDCTASFILISQPTNGVVVLNPDGTGTYTPNVDFVGMDAFSYGSLEHNSSANVSITIEENCLNSTSTMTESSCAPYLAPDGQSYNASGVYTAIIPNMAGCDSTITIDFTATNPTSSEIISVCESYTDVNGDIYAASGIYTYLKAGDLCDTIVTLDLTILNATMSSITESSCAPYIAPDGQSYDASGIYTAVIPNMAGCDSTITIDFTATNPTSTEIISSCESFTDENGDVYSASGIYTYLKAGDVCDTIVTLDLTILTPTTNSIVETSVCGAYTAPDGQEFTESGVYEVTIPNAEGCDSIISIDLTVTMPTMATVTVASCDDYTAADGMIYSISGVYSATIPNMAGCDSIITINYTKNVPTFSTVSPVTCDFYVSPTGQILTTSGVYTFVIPNAKGCDSTITVNLTSNPSVVASVVLQGDTTATAFPADLSYQWLNCETGEMITSATNQILQPIGGDYQVIVSNSFGCSDTTSCVTITNFANLNEQDFSNLVSIYPNPSNDVIFINLPENQIFILNLRDVNGKVLRTINSTKAMETFSLANFENGVYFLQFENEAGSFTKRIIKN